MYTLRTHERNGEKIYAPQNAPIINIQMNDPIIDLLKNYVAPDDNDYTLADLISLIKTDMEPKNGFLESDLIAFFEAIGLED